MKLGALGFENPFPRAHCVVLAFTAVRRDRSALFALSLAESAYHVPHPVLRGEPLLRRNGGSPCTIYSAESWAKLAGLKIVETYRPVTRVVEGGESRKWHDSDGNPMRFLREVGAPTLTQFRKTTGRRGAWVVLTNRHAQALVNGKYRGWHGARSRVIYAWRVQHIKTGESQ